MKEFLSFSDEFMPSHENVRDLALRDYLRQLVPESAEMVLEATYDTENKSIGIEFERLPGNRPTFYVDIKEQFYDDGSGIVRTLTMDEETGYVTDMVFDTYDADGVNEADESYIPHPTKAHWIRVLEMDFTSAVTKVRVDEVRKEIEALLNEA